MSSAAQQSVSDIGDDRSESAENDGRKLELLLRFDLRAPRWGTPAAVLYREMLHMARWADRRGFTAVTVSEHHGATDGYCPSPIAALAAVAAVTERVRLRPSALILSLHDPIRVAEDLAILDLLSDGRAEVLVGAGYRVEDFQMFGRDRSARGRLVEEGVAVLRAAWRGEEFEYRGVRTRVSPLPVQPAGPPILLGGSSPAAARRAARIADRYLPVDSDYDVYAEELAALGKPVPASFPTRGPAYIHVTHDPERDWRRIAPHIRHETADYAAQAGGGSEVRHYRAESDLERIRSHSQYRIVTPDGCRALIDALGQDALVTLHPLPAGLDPEIAWEGLELFSREVLPHLGVASRDGRGES